MSTSTRRDAAFQDRRSLRRGVVLDRRARADELPVAEGVVEARDRWPELAVARPRRRVGGELARVGVLPLVRDAGLDRVGRVLEGVVLAGHLVLLDLTDLLAD